MSKKSYYQFQKELNLPIYIGIDPQAFEASTVDFLLSMKFSKLSEKEEAGVQETLKKNNNARCLMISEATPTVARQIEATLESDRYGQESVIPKSGYRVYRFKGIALMVYSYGAKTWELGCYNDFGIPKENKQAFRMVINRYLSWSLSSLGILGLWGVTVSDGMVLQKARDSKGEVVFVDVVGNKIISIDGVKKLGPRFKILRLDPTLKARNIKMTTEELLSFISAHCAFLDYAGLSIPVRQMIQTLSKMSEGIVHPEESFRPRTDLSL